MGRMKELLLMLEELDGVLGPGWLGAESEDGAVLARGYLTRELVSYGIEIALPHGGWTRGLAYEVIKTDIITGDGEVSGDLQLEQVIEYLREQGLPLASEASDD